ncbi:MAG: ATP-binding cassette domain-containing protein [Sphaerobacter sp.]|nr:ATP-binding cassette domain-containing protein [Sphaerobacter sp.]
MRIFGFLGPNGAGKSTTIGVLCTLLRPSAGQVRVAGLDPTVDPDGVRRAIGIIFQDPSLDAQLTALENLAFHARVYHLPGEVWRPRAERLLRIVDLWDRRNDVVKTFSGDMKRRLEIARGLLHQPRVLFLDEPTIGLDPQTREHIWSYLEQLRAETGTTLFLTTHYMDEAERCDRIAIIDHGQIVALDTPDGLKSRVGGDVITLRTRDNARAAALIRERFALDTAHLDGTLRLEVTDGEAFIPRLVAGLDVPIETISLRRPSLDDVFIRLTGRAMRDEEVSGIDRMRAHMRARWRR